MFQSMLIYTFCWLVSYLLVNTKYKMLKRVEINGGETSVCGTQTPRKMPVWMIIVICVLFTFYNYYMTTNSVEMAGDRQNYLFDFEGGRESASTGLLGVMGIIYLFDGSFEMLLYVSSFISVFFALLAYRYSKEATPLSLLLLFLSLYILTSFTAIKQCYTSAFSTLALILMLQEKSKIKEVIIWMLIVLSMLFHPTGYILLPIYVYVRFFNTNYDVKRLIIFIFLFSLFFEPLLRIIGSALSFIPFLSDKINEYFGSEVDKWEEHGAMSVLKGLPFYYISYLGVKWRTRLKDEVEFYDEYLLMAIICSFFFIMNVYNYWMSRFMFLFLFVIYVFFDSMVKYIPERKIAILAVVFMTAVITYRDFYLIYTLYGGI